MQRRRHSPKTPITILDSVRSSFILVPDPPLLPPNMSPIRTRGYRKRQLAEQKVKAAEMATAVAATEALAAEVAMATTPSTPDTSPASTPVLRDTHRPPVRRFRSCGCFHITRENGQEHMILVDHSRVSVLVQPRPRQLSESKGSASSSCPAAGDNPTPSTPAVVLETSLTSDLEDCPEFPPKTGRQRRRVSAPAFWIGFPALKLPYPKTTHCPLTTHSPQAPPPENASSTLGRRLTVHYVQVPCRSNFKRRGTCSLASRDACQPPPLANTAIEHRTCQSETALAGPHGLLVDEAGRDSQLEACRPNRGWFSAGFLVFFCFTVLVCLARPVGST